MEGVLAGAVVECFELGQLNENELKRERRQGRSMTMSLNVLYDEKM